jgi:hypothetical protein
MIALETKTVTSTNLYTVGSSVAFAALPASPSQHRIFVRIRITDNINAASSRTVEVTLMDILGEIDYSNGTRYIPTGGTPVDCPAEFYVGPAVIQGGTQVSVIVGLSDNSADTDITLVYTLFSDDLEYYLAYRAAETTPTADSPIDRIKDVSADTTSILARIGDYAGTGLNTVKGFFQALFRKDAGVTAANLPSEINEAENTVTGAYTGATDSVEALRDRGDAAWITATSVTVSDKTGFSLAATGADLILKTSTFALAIADAVWDEILSGHAVVGSTGAGLSAASASGDPWSTALPGAYGAGTAGAIIGQWAGTGDSSVTITVTDGTNPLENVNVWLTSDEAGTNIIRSGVTTALGVMDPKPNLDDGTYYVWTSKGGYTPDDQPTTIVVAA